jgi:type II secretory pathway pseudopilin PulG
MIVVAIIGVLAAIAGPAYLKYIRTAKTSESLGVLRKIYDGEIAYYDIDHIDATGVRQSAQFTSAPATHTEVPRGEKVKGNWDGQEWAALRVGMDGPTNYSYEVTAAGVRALSSFTARAKGDLNGDGVTSLFERVGKIDPDTGEVVGGGGVFKSQELQ